MADGVAVAAADIAGVALDGVYPAALYLFHDPDVIRKAIPNPVFILPIKENNHAGCWYSAAVQPLAF